MCQCGPSNNTSVAPPMQCASVAPPIILVWPLQCNVPVWPLLSLSRRLPVPAPGSQLAPCCSPAHISTRHICHQSCSLHLTVFTICKMREEVKISSIHGPIIFKPADRVRVGAWSVTGVDKPREGRKGGVASLGSGLPALARPSL